MLFIFLAGVLPFSAMGLQLISQTIGGESCDKCLGSLAFGAVAVRRRFALSAGLRNSSKHREVLKGLQYRRDSAAAELVDAHHSRAPAGHLTDVASADHNTVKRGFDEATGLPPVPDLARAGFPLVGAQARRFPGTHRRRFAYTAAASISSRGFICPMRQNGAICRRENGYQGFLEQ